jgi:hypothetical protein
MEEIKEWGVADDRRRAEILESARLRKAGSAM